MLKCKKLAFGENSWVAREMMSKDIWYGRERGGSGRLAGCQSVVFARVLLVERQTEAMPTKMPQQTPNRAC